MFGTHLHVPAAVLFNLGINWAKGADEGRHTRELIQAHWDNHVLMWKGFKRVAAKTQDVGASISIEWAHRCMYHRLRATREIVNKYQLEYRKVSGCAVGLISRNPQTRGQLLCKAWGVWSNNLYVLDRLSGLECNKRHPSIPVNGQDTEHSGHYTNQLAKTLHVAFRLSAL